MEQNKEIWKDIEGYEGLYQISNFGNVKSLDNTVIYSNRRIRKHKSKLLKFGICRGYCIVNLYKNKRSSSSKVHRLVAQAFIPNPENKPTVNHKDGNKQNNCVDNLEWATIKENNNHAYTIGLMENAKRVRANNMAVISKKYLTTRIQKRIKKICQYDMKGNFLQEYDSVIQACKINKFNSPQNIRSCCQDKTQSAYGYKWSYKEKYEEKKAAT